MRKSPNIRAFTFCFDEAKLRQSLAGDANCEEALAEVCHQEMAKLGEQVATGTCDFDQIWFQFEVGGLIDRYHERVMAIAETEFSLVVDLPVYAMQLK